MIRARLLRIDEAPCNLEGDTWTKVAPDDHNLLWLDLEDASDEEHALAASKFAIAAPALEALRSVNRRPKVRVYKDYFVVTTLAVDVKEVERDSPRIEVVETEVLVGTNYLLTSHVRPWPEPFVAELEQRVSTNPYLGRLHAAYLLYVLLDTVVGNYAREFDEVEDRVERLEEQLLRDPGRKALDQATLMKRHVISLRRLVAPNREAFGVLGAADIPQIDREHVQPYFHDLLEHIDDFVDRLDHSRDVLTGAFNLYISNISHRTNQELRVLTFLSAVLLPMSVVTGLFGTNFALAEYQYAEPFYVMLAGMGVLAAGMLAFMRWQRWL